MIKKQKFRTGLSLFIVGFIGVLSILTGQLPLDNIPTEVLEQFSETAIKLLSLVNPTILLIISVVLGSLLYDKVDLQLPTLEKLLTGKDSKSIFISQLVYGVFGGVVAGIVLLIISLLFAPSLPVEFVSLGEKLKPTLLMRILYGGITEEILLRFGLMTLLVWVVYKVWKTLHAGVYWTGIVFSSIIFAIGHLPIAFLAVPDPSPGLMLYILLGNSLGGIVFGWLYWKKGLESSMLAHMFTHLVLMTGEQVIKFN